MRPLLVQVLYAKFTSGTRKREWSVKAVPFACHLQISANNSATGDIYCKEQKDIGLKRTIQRKVISLGENERRKLRRRVLGLERIEWRKEVR